MTIIASRPIGDAEGGTSRTAGSRPTDWAAKGRCVSNDPDAMFVRGAAQQNAKIICQKCPVIAECLADALDNRTEFGVWGGMTERERRAMLRRYPNVSSWWKVFETARLDQAEVSAAS